MPNIKSYQNFMPKMDIRQALSGSMRAAGVFFDAFGRQQRTFHAVMQGAWQGNTGTLHEEFTFNNGEQQTRNWQVTVRSDDDFTATAGDVAGTATGQQSGNAINMRYQLMIPIGKNKVKIDMDDWMYLVDDKTIINRTVMRKFGIRLGELALVIQKC